MKKLTILFLTLFMLCGCQSKENNSFDPQTPENNTDVISETSNEDADVKKYQETIASSVFEELSYDDVHMIYTNDDFTGFLYIGRETCPYCQRAIEIYEDVASNEGYLIYYMDSTKAKENDNFEIYNGFNFVIDENGNSLSSVPILIAFKNGKPITSYVGVTDDYNDASVDPDNVQYMSLYSRVIEMYKLMQIA